MYGNGLANKSRKWLIASSLCIGLANISQCTFAASKEVTATLTLQDVFTQERAWAGLTTKTYTVTDPNDPTQTVHFVYSEGGDPTKPTVLLVHGLFGSRDNWNRVAHALTKDYHVIIPDLPGHGDTTQDANYDYQIPNITPSIRRFLEGIHAEKNLNIAGHSLGGGIAILYSSLYFMDTQSLLLVDPAGVYKSQDGVISQYQKDPESMREMVVRKPGDAKKVMDWAMFSPPFIPKQLFNLQEQMMINHQETNSKVIEMLITTLKNFQPETMSIPLRSIECPVQIIWGEKDKMFNVSAAKEITAHLKHAEPVVIIPNIGHTPILEADQIVSQHYLAFLKGAGRKPNLFSKAIP